MIQQNQQRLSEDAVEECTMTSLILAICGCLRGEVQQGPSPEFSDDSKTDHEKYYRRFLHVDIRIFD
jgi:hypothetical protein